jgi:hypothetical protein
VKAHEEKLGYAPVPYLDFAKDVQTATMPTASLLASLLWE